MASRSFYPGDKVHLIQEMNVAVENNKTYTIQTTDVGTVIEWNPRSPQYVSCEIVAVRFHFSRWTFIFLGTELQHVD